MTADVNGDGSDAILVLGDDRINVYQGSGTDAGRLLASTTLNSHNIGFTVVDLNHDGIPDVLVTNALGDILPMIGKGDGRFEPYQAPADVAMVVSDLNGDGKDDFVFADKRLDRISVDYGGQGASTIAGASAGILAPGAVTLADLDGDGTKDLIVAKSGANAVLVYRGLPDGRFRA